MTFQSLRSFFNGIWFDKNEVKSMIR